jgi:hypothetical protein
MSRSEGRQERERELKQEDARNANVPRTSSMSSCLNLYRLAAK